MLLLLLQLDRICLQTSAGSAASDQDKLPGDGAAVRSANDGRDLPAAAALQLAQHHPSVLLLPFRQVIARCSFVLLLLFLCMLVICLCRNRLSMVVNEGLFTVKFITLVVLFVGALFVGSSFFEGYSQVARILSLAYMLMQSVILIDIFYILGRSLVRRYE